MAPPQPTPTSSGRCHAAAKQVPQQYHDAPMGGSTSTLDEEADLHSGDADVGGHHDENGGDMEAGGHDQEANEDTAHDSADERTVLFVDVTFINVNPSVENLQCEC